MIVFCDFFYKAHPHYLDRAVDLMRKVNECGLIIHDNLGTFINKLKDILKEDGGDRYKKGVIGLSVAKHQIQIEVKGGMDYAARICYFELEKGLGFSVDQKRLIQVLEFDSAGQLRHRGKVVYVWI